MMFSFVQKNFHKCTVNVLPFVRLFILFIYLLRKVSELDRLGSEIFLGSRYAMNGLLLYLV